MFKPVWLSCVFAATLSGFSAQRASADTGAKPLALQGQTFIHDPSTILKDDGRYYVFGTGLGIISKSSPDLIHWTIGPAVFDEMPAWTTQAVPEFAGRAWAPDVIRVGDRFLMYYSVSTLGKQVSAIGLVASPTLNPKAENYRWTDLGTVIQSTNGGSFNTIDPSVMLDRDGKLWMAFGSYWKGIYLTELDPKTGLRADTNSAPIRLASNDQIEASCLTRHSDFYYLFVNWGHCCRGTNSTYEVRVGRSRKVTGPFVDRAGKNLVDKGGTLFLESSGRFIGPGHVGILNDGGTPYFSYHYYDGASQGLSRLAIGRIRWTDDGWPEAQ